MGIANWMNLWTVLFPLTVLLYYFFRKRYETRTISSTLFWEKAMRETDVSPYLRNLQRNALFYLQMAALLLFVFTMLSPFIAKEESVTGHTVWIVDTSASMLAEVDGKSIFSIHKEQMMQMAQAHEGQPLTILTTGKEPSILLRKETDPEVVRGAIDKIAVTYEHEHLIRSIEIAQSLAAGDAASIHIFSDHVERTALPDADSRLSWVIHANEKPIDNVSIERFGAVSGEHGVEAIVKLRNSSSQKMNGFVRLYNPDTERPLIESTFAIEGGGEQLLPFQNLPAGLSGIIARLEVKDSYPVDNEAAVLLGENTSQVLVDSKLHELIKKAFEATGMQVTSGTIVEMHSEQESSIVVTNEVSMLEQGRKPVILIGRNDEQASEVTGTIEQLPDPLFTVVDIHDVYVNAIYPPFNGFKTIATIDGKPFIQKSERGDLVILTDIERTDWPLHPSFPLFIWSASQSIHSGSDIVGMFTPNERKSIVSGSGGSEEIEIYSMDDQYITSYPSGTHFVSPSKPGLYRVIEGEDEKFLVVQLEDSEKSIGPGESFKVLRNASELDVEVGQGKRFIGSWFLMPILLLLLIEWEVQRRRGYPH